MRQLLFIALLTPMAGFAADEAPAPSPVAVASPAAPAASAAPAAAAPKQICRRETPLGTNRPVTVCHNVDDPNDPNATRSAEDLARQLNQAGGVIGRAGH